jgi:alginate O-acetyltransferase complex protein AlgI
MLFFTLDFLAFFAFLFALYWLLPWRHVHLRVPGMPALRGDEMRVWLLLAASLVFYAGFNRKLVILVVCTALLDYLLARGMDAWTTPRLRKWLLAVSVATNLGLLGYFKYANFFLESLEQLLQACGVRKHLPVLEFLFPVGLSYYTLAAIDYTVSVYRRRIAAERDPAHHLLFVLFFPNLLAGPIGRARDFLPQVRCPKCWNWVRFRVGVELCLAGVFKHVVLAKHMYACTDPVFCHPGAYGSGTVALAVLGCAVELYCDFSAYTDLAEGTAHLLGYRLPVSFRLPYLATSIADFWQRWYVSLPRWLHEHVYRPLGGGSGGTWRAVRNLLLTMTLAGLWFGAGWNFVVFGLLHGVLLVVNRGVRALCRARPSLDGFSQSAAGTTLRRCATFAAVCAGWVVFRSNDLGNVWEMFHRPAVPYPDSPWTVPTGNVWWAAAAVALAHAGGAFGVWWRFGRRLPAPVLGVGYAAAVVCCFVLAPPPPPPPVMISGF